MHHRLLLYGLQKRELWASARTYLNSKRVDMHTNPRWMWRNDHYAVKDYGVTYMRRER